MKTLLHIALANEASPLATLANANYDLPGEANADTLFIPFSEVANQGLLQRFDSEAAVTMANVFAGDTGKLGKLWDWLTGKHRAQSVPVYVGHPDHSPQSYKDHAAKGWVTAVRALPNGMELDVAWTAEGRSLVQSGAFKKYSPYWNAVQVEGLANTYRPVQLISVGLTNYERIPVRPLSNSEDEGADEVAQTALEGEPTQTQQEASEEPASILQAVRTALGLADDAARDLVITAIAQATEAAERMPALESARDAAVAELEALRAELEGSRQQATASEQAREAAAAETARATDMANAANTEAQHARGLYLEQRLAAMQASGHLAPRDYLGTTGRLMALANVAELQSALDELASASPALATSPAPGVEAAARGKPLLADLANAAGENGDTAKAARQAFLDAAIAQLTALGVHESQRYSMAWQRLHRDRPDLLPQ